jgi:hypothetical protein
VKPLFPDYQRYGDGDFGPDGGISIREYFAAQAMAGLLSNGHTPPKDVPEAALYYADRLIAELSKPKDAQP